MNLSPNNPCGASVELVLRDTKDDASSKAQSVLYVRCSVRKLGSYPISLENPNAQMAPQAEIDATTDLKS
jgi:hypothetical protein